MDINQFKRTIEGRKNYNLSDICRCLLSSASHAKKEFRAQSPPISCGEILLRKFNCLL